LDTMGRHILDETHQAVGHVLQELGYGLPVDGWLGGCDLRTAQS
jgi:hypothetical protein